MLPAATAVVGMNQGRGHGMRAVGRKGQAWLMGDAKPRDGLGLILAGGESMTGSGFERWRLAPEQ